MKTAAQNAPPTPYSRLHSKNHCKGNHKESRLPGEVP